MLKTEAQMGPTYVIRYRNFPVGMIFVDAPLYNKNAIGVPIWTVDFFIAESFEHKHIMYNSLARVLSQMKTAMRADYVYALVDEANTDCLNIIDNGLFSRVDNTGFATHGSEKKPLVFMIDLTKMRFEKR